MSLKLDVGLYRSLMGETETTMTTHHFVPFNKITELPKLATNQIKSPMRKQNEPLNTHILLGQIGQRRRDRGRVLKK